MSRFQPTDRGPGFLLPPNLDDWLPEDHLARFVAEVVEQLDLRELTSQYRGGGALAYHPAMLLGLLIYGYATGVHSSRIIEQATYDSIAFRYLAANAQPAHDTLAHFRRRFLPQIHGPFKQVLVLAREMKLLKLGRVALDDAKLHANASRHKALSHGHAGKLEAQLGAEVDELMRLAEQADRYEREPGADLPRSWPVVRIVWHGSPRPRPRSRRGPGSALTRSRRLSRKTKPGVRRRRSERARSLAVGRHSRPVRVRGPKIK